MLGFGCMRLPTLGDDPTKIDEETATTMIRQAIDQGVNFIDTAYSYHSQGLYYTGENEPFISRVLEDGYREKVMLSTKLPCWRVENQEDMEFYLEHQLERLNTQCIDFYMLHGLNQTYWEKMKELNFETFLEEAQDQGKIKHAGFSFHDRLDLFKEIVDYYDWSFCLLQYNYLDEYYQVGTEGIKYAANKGLGIAVMEPLRGGQLASKIPKEVQELFNQAKIKRTPAEWALRWVWNNPLVSVVLSGMNSMEDVKENLRIANNALPHSLSSKELELIGKARVIFKGKQAINCTYCGYCLPCPAGVDIPENFARYNDYHLFGSPEEKARFQFSYEAAVLEDSRPSNCTACRQCEKQCTQKIAIVDELRKVQKLYEGD
ncbi:aldo/keto reductase [Methanobacterium sp.]|uniref:aldo/keto reductase n=1 Tax=Methanobacterium sp. TaxID=2164 RepID=UPI00260A131F|nr:aldo/keto reductase [Methanobacterium sp.]